MCETPQQADAVRGGVQVPHGQDVGASIPGSSCRWGAPSTEHHPSAPGVLHSEQASGTCKTKHDGSMRAQAGVLIAGFGG